MSDEQLAIIAEVVLNWKPTIPRATDLAVAIDLKLREPRIPAAADHEHEWVKVDEEHQGLTQIRTYECRGCLAHTTLTGPMGIKSPFEVEK